MVIVCQVGIYIDDFAIFVETYLDNSRYSRYSLNRGSEWVEIDNTKTYIFLDQLHWHQREEIGE